MLELYVQRIFISNKNKQMQDLNIKYGNEITGKLVRETFKSLPTDNWSNDTLRVEDNFECELEFKVGFGNEVKKGDFKLIADCSRSKTRVILFSQQSRFEDEYTRKEWLLEEMTSQDWRFIEDKIRRAKKRIASDSRQNWMVYDSSLSFFKMEYNKETRNWEYIDL